MFPGLCFCERSSSPNIMETPRVYNVFIYMFLGVQQTYSYDLYDIKQVLNVERRNIEKLGYHLEEKDVKLAFI